MAHFVPTLDGDGFLNLDTVDGVLIMEPSSPSGAYLVVAERHGQSNTILTKKASREQALAFIRELLGDTIHDG